MCGWNIHSSLPERQNFSTLLVSFTWEMNLLRPWTISFFPSKYQENVQSLSLCPYTFILWWCKDKWDKLWGDWCCSVLCTEKTKVGLGQEKKDRHTIMMKLSVSLSLKLQISISITIVCFKDIAPVEQMPSSATCKVHLLSWQPFLHITTWLLDVDARVYWLSSSLYSWLHECVYLLGVAWLELLKDVHLGEKWC